MRRTAGPFPTRDNGVFFEYLDCDALRCAPPLQISSGPACDESSFSDLDRQAKTVTVRGVPAARFDETLFLFSGDVTITLSGERKVVDLAVRALKPAGDSDVPRAGASAATLPPPVPGHLSERLYCGLPWPSVTAIGQRARVRLAFDLAATGALSGEVWPAGAKIDPELGIHEGTTTPFLFRSGKGRGAGTVTVKRPGRYEGEAVATARDGRRSRPVRLAFEVPR